MSKIYPLTRVVRSIGLDKKPAQPHKPYKTIIVETGKRMNPTLEITVLANDTGHPSMEYTDSLKVVPEYFPEFEHMLRWDRFNAKTGPIHYIANSLCHLGLTEPSTPCHDFFVRNVALGALPGDAESYAKLAQDLAWYRAMLAQTAARIFELGKSHEMGIGYKISDFMGDVDAGIRVGMEYGYLGRRIKEKEAPADLLSLDFAQWVKDAQATIDAMNIVKAEYRNHLDDAVKIARKWLEERLEPMLDKMLDDVVEMVEKEAARE